ncbi:MAG: hypothetical protein ACRDTV_20330 [Mycobacterium sp.]
MRKPYPWTLLGVAALAGLAVLSGVGVKLDTPATGRTVARIPVAEVATSTMPQTPPLTSDQQKLLNELPAGYSASSCTPDDSPEPDSLADLDCDANSNPGGPSYADYMLFASQATMDSHFQDGASNVTLQPCPGKSSSAPETWTYDENPNVTAGQVFCAASNGTPVVVWTTNSKLVLSIAGSTDLASLYKWWQQYG